jgi:hypothetical protein
LWWFVEMMKNKNKQSVVAKVAKRRGRGQTRSVVPARYPRASGDTFVMPFKFTELLEVPSGDFTVSRLLVLGNGTNSTGYIFLNSKCPQFSAGIGFTSRWVITDLTVEVRATGVGGNANTFIAASYIPSNSSVDSPPNTLGELSNSAHYAESALGTIGRFTVKPTEYFNDWRQVNDSDDSDAQMGLIQLYGSGSGGSSAITAGVYTVSGVLHFCGLRY